MATRTEQIVVDGCGPVEVRYIDEDYITFEVDDLPRCDVIIPTVEDVDDPSSYELRQMREGVRVSYASTEMSGDQAARFGHLLAHAGAFAEQHNAKIAEMLPSLEESYATAEQRRREERERERLAWKERQEREAEITKEREERCLMEFADEEVRVRARGYKSVVKAVVRVRETGIGYTPYVEYVHDNDYSRPNRISQIRRLEIKQGSRYKVVWDDGRDDLPEYDRGARANRDAQIKPYEGR